MYPRGCYISLADKGKVAQVLEEMPVVEGTEEAMVDTTEVRQEEAVVQVAAQVAA